VATFEQMDVRLRAYPRQMEAETRKALEASLLILEADQRRNVAQDTRRLMGSITREIQGTGAVLTGRVGPTVGYGIVVERGRRPGKYPPIAAIQGWARRHGIPPFLLARAIARRGTRPQPFVGPSLDRNRERINVLFRQVGVRMIARLAVG
jgi:hypothetical protein